jgi:NB-ARC domain/Trypsin-like peptidase domain
LGFHKTGEAVVTQTMPFEDHFAVITKNEDQAGPAGAGVWLGDSLLLTCAHVVNVALGRKIEDASRPSGILSVRFPSVSGRNFQAQIAGGEDSWSSPPASSKSGRDICLLEVSGCQAPPAQLWEVRTLIGRHFRTGGFPPDWRGDLDIANGEIVGADGPLYMLRPNAETFAALISKPKSNILGLERRPAGLIHPGFSGSPVEVDGKIVGLVAEARVLSSEATAYMIPVSSLPSRIRRLKEQELLREQSAPGSAPPIPPVFVGREDTIEALKVKLGIRSSTSAGSAQVITAVRGWPGVGKTTLAAALANDSEVRKALPDGVLWVSIGERPDLISAIASWGRRLGRDDLLGLSTVTEATDALAALLRNRQMLLIVDDVWETAHAEPFRRARGSRCTLVITTRLTTVAEDLAPVPDALFQIPVLTEENAVKLFSVLAPNVARDYPKEVRELVRDLEFLPLALQVAGHLANAEARRGWDVPSLLADLRNGVRILEAKAPADRADFESQTIPTVSALLKQSVNRLPRSTQDYFAFLGAFAPKPATFDLAAMSAVWELDDPRPIVDMLIDRGLLEPVGSGRFQMHALLVALAKSFLLSGVSG